MNSSTAPACLVTVRVLYVVAREARKAVCSASLGLAERGALLLRLLDHVQKSVPLSAGNDDLAGPDLGHATLLRCV